MIELSAPARRQQDRLRKWANRQRTLQTLVDAGVPFRRGAEEGPASGIAYLEHPAGPITLRLESAIWTQVEKKGRGCKSLLEYLGK